MKRSGGNLRLGVAMLALVLGTVAAWAEPPASPPVSKFAPIDDLANQIDLYAKEIDTALVTPADYDEVKKTKVKKQAHTITVLALSLGMHDEDHPLKSAAPALIETSQALAKASENTEEAVAARNALMSALKAGPATGEVAWKQVASQGQLMKQVNTLHTRLKRSVTPTRFKRTQKESAGDAAVLAAIGQAILFDTHEVKNEADLPKWYELSAEFRDLAGELNAACRNDDQAQAAALVKKLEKSCSDCHKVFHHP
jgi:cytochrome c556